MGGAPHHLTLHFPTLLPAHSAACLRAVSAAGCPSYAAACRRSKVFLIWSMKGSVLRYWSGVTCRQAGRAGRAGRGRAARACGHLLR